MDAYLATIKISSAFTADFCHDFGTDGFCTDHCNEEKDFSFLAEPTTSPNTSTNTDDDHGKFTTAEGNPVDDNKATIFVS